MCLFESMTRRSNDYFYLFFSSDFYRKTLQTQTWRLLCTIGRGCWLSYFGTFEVYSLRLLAFTKLLWNGHYFVFGNWSSVIFTKCLHEVNKYTHKKLTKQILCVCGDRPEVFCKYLFVGVGLFCWSWILQ